MCDSQMSGESLKNQLWSLRRENEQLREEIQQLKIRLGIMPDPIAEEKSKPGQHSDTFTKYNSPGEKIALFQSLFRGRPDVYANRWENKKGRSGYSPACDNEWKPGICAKPKIKCSACPHQKFKPLDEKAVDAHLRGQLIVGLYPLLVDDCCYFLAIDFDKKEWDKDVLALMDACKIFEIPMAMERSRSGNGAHAWFFFEEKTAAAIARKFGSALLTYSMDQRHELSFSSYDRLFPNQNTLPKGGFGNLIALPLQQAARKKGNSSFINNQLIPYPDQWSFLSSIKKLSKEKIEEITKQLCKKEDELGDLRKDKIEEKPWERKKVRTPLTKQDFPEEVSMIKADRLYIPKPGFSQKGLNALKRLAAFKNPQFYKTQAMRLPVYNKPRIISCADETKEYVCLPRGCEEDIKDCLSASVKEIHLTDKRNSGKEFKVAFKGKLRPEQALAVNKLLQYESGVLSAPPAFGKTVMAAKVIARRKTNTLVLVHRKQLMEQWKSRLNHFLDLSNEDIGLLGGGKNTLTQKIDIAIMQSLYQGKEVKEVVRNYGMVIVDECHHIPAFSFEQILKQANAKYVYGLTATPLRQDGHHPIIFMYCGPIRYKINPGKQAEERPFDHFVIPRFTDFFAPKRIEVNPEKEKPRELSIQGIYRKITCDGMRNQLIADDVIKNYKKGRNALVLTERTAHVQILAELLKEDIPEVVTLTGGKAAAESKLLFKKIEGLPDDKQITIIATGKFIGEGFDESRLDTLFLAMPISWKGTLQQYTGRLHRLNPGKKKVLVFDYVDIHVKTLERMYTKRLNAYASIGYKVKGENLDQAPASIIFDKDNFLPVFSSDVRNAKREIVIVSPFVSQWRSNQMLPLLQEAINNKIKVIILTRPAESFKNKEEIKPVFEKLKEEHISLIFQSGIHQKFAVIDHKISWYGSINLLSYGRSQESMMRIESGHIAGELLRSMEM